MACISSSAPKPYFSDYSLHRSSLPSSSPPLTMSATALYLPKDDPRKPLGEDAHFVINDNGKSTFGVADGVGGWAREGINAGQYARELMENTAAAVLGSAARAVDPKTVLKEGFLKTKTLGSSTACIVTLDKTLRAANVGDSGFCVVRKGKVVYKSPTMQRSFNCPYQLGLGRDNASVAEEIEVVVERGDVVVAGTDGFFDNMEIEEIEERVTKMAGMSPESIALWLGNIALYNSFDRFRETLFSRAAKLATGVDRRGGKIDDITVIVAHIR